MKISVRYFSNALPDNILKQTTCSSSSMLLWPLDPSCIFQIRTVLSALPDTRRGSKNLTQCTEKTRVDYESFLDYHKPHTDWNQVVLYCINPNGAGLSSLNWPSMIYKTHKSSLFIKKYTISMVEKIATTKKVVSK